MPCFRLSACNFYGSIIKRDKLFIFFLPNIKLDIICEWSSLLQYLFHASHLHKISSAPPPPLFLFFCSQSPAVFVFLCLPLVIHHVWTQSRWCCKLSQHFFPKVIDRSSSSWLPHTHTIRQYSMSEAAVKEQSVWMRSNPFLSCKKYSLFLL